MKIADILESNCVLPQLKATNKKQVLQDIAGQLASVVAIDKRIIFEALFTR